jgi:mannosyltransferase OCH1-like enzyme
LDSIFEDFWRGWCDKHPHWDHVTVRDPLDPADWPRTGHLFKACVHGAQIAGLVRLEAVWRWGGLYVDADFECLRPLDPLIAVVGNCFIGTQDGTYLTDALFGAAALHPAIDACIERVVTLDMVAGPLVTGPDNTTAVLTGRSDVTVVPPAAFYPYLWTEPERRYEDFRTTAPHAYAVHHWNSAFGGSAMPSWFNGS